jgi:ABC-type transport system substrate-binding protein
MVARVRSLVLVGALFASGCTLSTPDLVEANSRAPESVVLSTPTPVDPPESMVIPEVLALAQPFETDLRLGVVSIPPTDPLAASVVDPAHMVFIDLLYDGLTEWDATADTWQPNLARSLTASEDGLTWTVDLDPTRTFSDGTPIDARRVADSFSRVMSASGTLASTRFEVVQSVAVDSASTLRFTLATPFAELPGLLSSPVFGVVPDDAPTGMTVSGPLVLEQGVRMAPWNGSDVVGVVLTPMRDEPDAIAALHRGEVDLVFLSAAASEVPDIERLGLVEAHFGLNVRARALSDVLVRLTIIGAVDRSVVASAGFANGAVAIVGLDAHGASCADACAGPVANVELADSVEISYVVDETGREARLADALAQQLQVAGLSAESTGYSLTDFVDLIASGNHEIVRTGWVGLYPSADSQLAPYLGGGRDNITGFSDAEVDGQIAAARLSGSAQAYRAAAELVLAQGAVVPIARLRLRALVGDDVTGLMLRPDGTFDIESIVLAR